MKKPLVLLLLLFAVSCEETVEVIPEPPLTHVASEYLPAQAGDRYTYMDRWKHNGVDRFVDTITYNVTGEVVKDGRTYVEYLPVIKQVFLPGEGWVYRSLDTLYRRTEEGRVYRWLQGRDELYIDFRKKWDDDQASLPLEFVLEVPRVKAGGLEHDSCIIVWGGRNAAIAHTYAKGVGLVHSEETEGHQMSLIGASVRGRMIP
jgi:hypothetical protein